MTFDEFEKFQHGLYKEICHLKDTKGKEYAHDADRFANFKRTAAQKGVSPLLVASIFLQKHLDSIDSFVKEGRVFSEEPIRGRFKDAIMYLFLMAGIVEEIQNKPGTVYKIPPGVTHIERKHQPFEFDPNDGGPNK